MFYSAAPLALTLPSWIHNYLAWWIAAIIVIGGILIFGLNELVRLSIKRIWAISSVCFAESIRRRVLWVVPLAIIGVIVVSQLQHALDPQEGLRETIKFCLFASGLIVVVTAVILASTNLPREIESRVIFTIVTKPTTRLELVLGKVLGFARMSGLLVLIMGLFTFAWVGLQDSRLNAQIAERLKTEKDPSTIHTLEGYQKAGLLSTKSLQDSEDLQIFEHFQVTPHGPRPDDLQWLTGAYGYSFLVPFTPTEQQKSLLETAITDPNRYGILVINTMPLKRPPPTKTEQQWILTNKAPLENQELGPLPGAAEIVPMPLPQLEVNLFDQDLNLLVASKDVNGGKPATAERGHLGSTEPYRIISFLDPSAVRTLLSRDKFVVHVIPETNSVQYGVSPKPTVIDIYDSADPNPQTRDHVIQASGPPRFVSTAGRYGMKIVGKDDGSGSVADFRFSGAQVPANLDQSVAVRFHAGIERTGEYNGNVPWSVITLTVVNRDTHESSGPIEFHPESNRDFSVLVPGKFVKGGNFDVFVRGMDTGQFIGLTKTSVQLISAEHSFALNLLASLLVLWLLSVLVVVIAIFSSTFLSWPIAVVLTLLILLGHWGVEQLGDTINPGVGRGVAADLGFQNATQLQVFSASVDVLTKALTAIAAVLPDLSKFPVMENITRGVATPPAQIGAALGVLACYALPMLVVTFIILKNKEVAP